MTGSVGRYARHTQLSASLQRSRLSERVKYAPDMAGAPSGETEATYVIYGISPMYQFSGTVNNSICTEIKIPDDRVPGTPVTLEAEYFMGAGPNGLPIMLVLRTGVYGKGEAPTALGASRWNYMPKTSPAAPNTDTATTTIWPSDIDGKAQPVDMQLVFTRRAADPGDVDANALYLIKITMRYQSYL